MPDEEVVITEANTENQPPASAEPPAAPASGAIKLSDVPEKELLQFLNDKLGTDYKSMDEAKPKLKVSKEDEEAQAVQKKQRSLEWALSSGKIKQSDLELAIREKSRSPRDIALSLFAAEMREEDAKLTDQDIEEQFKDYYREEEDENSSVRKAAQKRMEKVANAYLSDVTKGYDSIESDYDQAQSESQKFNGYTAVVKEAAKTIPESLSFKYPYKTAAGATEDLEYTVAVDKSVIDAVRKEFAHENTYFLLGANETAIKPETLLKEMSDSVKARMVDKIIPSLLAQHQERVERDLAANLKAVPYTGPGNFNKKADPTKKVPTYDNLKKVQDGKQR